MFQETISKRKMEGEWEEDTSEKFDLWIIGVIE
jgi:hypothetical protein